MPREKRTKVSQSPNIQRKMRDTETEVDTDELADVQSTTSNSVEGDPALLDEEEIPSSAAEPASKIMLARVYSGMPIGGSHTWNYDQGVWKESKEEPDLWKIDFETTKRRARNAPKGSGAPVGTEYHWMIVAHQHVKKVDANTYTTHLTGSKYKLAHKNGNSGSWSIPSVKGQRERESFILEDAKRRVEGLPPVLPSEKIKMKKETKGQKTLDSLFAGVKKDGGQIKNGKKRKREDAKGAKDSQTGAPMEEDDM